ncbi:hypothetical protein BAE44_0025878 [Dichanthelium oligosanthes]|uniref:F-box domain-containing protein n=1 Tax=Dichanthelium oligosanthes TaxID=888268 RepID=A0A1E5UJQ2_9POAL|nr:hypothetical protein BAE44_0025878 [Dichanthelium oligosanthes]
MARIKRPRRCERPSSDGGGGVDHLSALPDDLLRLILRRLDTRTALSTAVLARRWASLPREFPALQLRVSDVLPGRYHRGLALRRSRAQGHPPADAVLELDALIARCEHRAMRAFADGVVGLLEAGGGGEGDGERRRAKSLCLEFFATEESGCVDRLISTAVGAWGVEDLEVVARPPHLNLYDGPAYTFPHHCLDDELHRSRLRSLTLANCTVPPLYRYGALAELVMRDMPESTPIATYQRLFTARSPLKVLRLLSCRCAEERLVISAPTSQIRELVVDGCSFLEIDLRTLPMLERLACLTNSVELRFGAVPRLGHVNLSFSKKSAWGHDELGCFLEGVDTVASLAVRFTGPDRWIVLRPLDTKLRGLTKLLVADVPSSWDVTWTRLLLMAAPALEVLHIHVAPSEPDEKAGCEISWPAFKYRHRRLREVALTGFERTWRQIFFVRYLARVCKAMQRVLLLKDWCVRAMGLWDWELLQQQECPWSEEEKMVVTRQVKYGRYWCRPQLEVIVG